MNARTGTLLAVAVTAASLAFGLLVLVIGRVDMGIRLEQDGAYVRIASESVNQSPATSERAGEGAVSGARHE